MDLQKISSYKMENRLELIARSYDKGIDSGRKGVDLYDELPERIKNDPDYPLFQKMKAESTLSDSGRKEIKEFLSPDINMRFIDLGCCLNLMFRGYDKWPSTYYGIDISGKTIQLLNEFVSKKNLSVGALRCESIHKTSFDAGYFDIGACIGVLEYFEKGFIEKAITEAHRIIKPYGKFVLDVPDAGSPEHRITMLIEEYLGRPDMFNMPAKEFEEMLRGCFEIKNKEKAGPMIQYFLNCKK